MPLKNFLLKKQFRLSLRHSVSSSKETNAGLGKIAIWIFGQWSVHGLVDILCGASKFVVEDLVALKSKAKLGGVSWLPFNSPWNSDKLNLKPMSSFGKE